MLHYLAMRGRAKKQGVIVDLRLVDIAKVSSAIFFTKEVQQTVENVLRANYVATRSPRPVGTAIKRSTRPLAVAKAQGIFWQLHRAIGNKKVCILVFLVGVLTGIGMGVAACSL